MTILDKLISTALSEAGYLEKASNAWLDDKTKNAGKANYTKYGKWYGINPGAWCAMFVSWCADKAGAGSIIPKHASCSLGIEAWKKLGRWHPRKGYSPQKGDIIYFCDKNSAPAHVGIVYELDHSYVYTIEGNTSGGSGVIANGGGVAQKYYPQDYGRILGYGNPDWAALEKTKSNDNTNDNTKEADKVTLGEIAAAREQPGHDQRYDRIADMPEWARPHIRELVKMGALQGIGEIRDEDGFPADLDLSMDMIRTLIICKRIKEG